MLLKVANLKISASLLRGESDILRGADFCVRSGEPLAIIGESGSGKTMLSLSLLGLLPENCHATGSAVLCDDESATDNGADMITMTEREKNAMRGRELIYIPQSGAEYLSPALKVKTQLFESLKKLGIKAKTELEDYALYMLGKAGLSDASVLEKYPYQLSGGQAQRVTFAMSLSPRAKLVIADEPTNGIDGETAKIIERGLFGYFADACVIVITHSLELAKKCSQVLVLNGGEVVEYGAAEKVLTAPECEYTRELISCMPDSCSPDPYASDSCMPDSRMPNSFKSESCVSDPGASSSEADYA